MERHGAGIRRRPLTAHRQTAAVTNAAITIDRLEPLQIPLQFTAQIAFDQRLVPSDRMDDVVILTMSEFGRTVRQNGTGGTDHGHAGAMFVLGGNLKGQKTVHGKWPGLAPEQLYEGRDLALTTDFRSVFSELASKHLGAASMDKMFPGFTVDQSKWVGLL